MALNPVPQFDRVARAYRWMEYASFGRALERCRYCRLLEMGGARRGLILADGDGRFTARLLVANREIEVAVVDASPAMLARARRAAVDDGARAQFFQADLRAFTPPGTGYDLVTTHFFLDCLTEEEIAELLRRVRPRMAPGGRWVVSEFAIPPVGWRRWAGRAIVGGLYRAFGLLTGLRQQQLPRHGEVFRAAGLEIRDERVMLGGVLVSQVWSGPALHTAQVHGLDAG